MNTARLNPLRPSESVSAPRRIYLPHSIWGCLETWLIALFAFLVMLIALPQRAQGVEQFAAVPGVAVRVPAGDLARGPGKLPFSAMDVASYFSTVLEMSPERDAKGVASFENYHVSHAEDRWTITVRTEGKEVVVEFLVGGDYGLSLARDFFESPLFVRDESEQFYAMLNEAQNAPSQRLPRFTLQMSLRQTTDLITLTLRFAPLEAA